MLCAVACSILKLIGKTNHTLPGTEAPGGVECSVSSMMILFVCFCVQTDNGGIVMATFVPNFKNCKDPDSAALKDVAGVVCPNALVCAS